MDRTSFDEKNDWLSATFEEYTPFDFYRFVFPEGSFERRGEYDDEKANGIAVSIKKNAAGVFHGNNILITDGLEQIEKLIENPEDFVVISPIGYWGMSRKAENARWLYALVLDIDYVNLSGLQHLVKQLDDDENDLFPRPTFIVNSGAGIHCYFCFKKPIAMFKPAQAALKQLKAGLIYKIWNKKLTDPSQQVSYRPERAEVLGIVQGFRMVGGYSKLGKDAIIRAFKTGDRVDLDYLNRFVGRDYKATNLRYQSKCTLEYAKEHYPEWYERVVVQGHMPGRWYVKPALYEWWVRKLKEEGLVSIGHRYFCTMCLAIYAAKCDIPQETLEADASYFMDRFNRLSRDGTEPFTEDDMTAALQAYNETFVKYPRSSMEYVSGISIPKNESRKWKPQYIHLETARSNRDIYQKHKGTHWWDNGNRSGAPSKEKRVKDYAREHQNENHTQIAKALGISRPTVIKWLKDEEQGFSE